MTGNIDSAALAGVLGQTREGGDRTGQRCPTYELAEALLRHLYADGRRGEVRLHVGLDEGAWAKYRAEVQRPYRGEPSVVVVPVPGVGAMEFRRAHPSGALVAHAMSLIAPEAT